MKLTEEQKRAVAKNDGHTLITACPGSGKTRVIIAKLLRCLDEVRGTARRVACITYTNAAVHEIEARLRRYGQPGDDALFIVSTIHAFCLNEVLRHFYWLTRQYSNGFSVAPPDSDPFIRTAQAVCCHHGIPLTKVAEHFELLNREPAGEPIIPAGSLLTDDAVQDFWDRLAGEGHLDFPNIVHLSYSLLKAHAFVRRAVATRFAWMLVDEFQDTSALQVEVFKLLHAEGHTKFFLVGDPLQSIFGFAGARPELMARFARHISADESTGLNGNFRSSSNIIAHADRLCSRDHPMSAIGVDRSYDHEPEYHEADTAFDAIVDYYLPALAERDIPVGKAAILAPWWIKLLHLGRQLREYGVPIFGPGARPYKRTHLFAMCAEQICAYIDHPAPDLIPSVERELYSLLLQVNGRASPIVYSYSGRSCVFKLLHEGQRLRETHEGAIDWLREAAGAFARVLSAEELLPTAAAKLLTASVEEMRAEMIRNDVDVDNLGVADLGLFAHPERSLKLITMHRAKGREYDAVAVVDLHDGRVPHYSATTAAEIDEGRRVLYVAITRAKRVLMYICDREHPRNRPSRFLRNQGLQLV